MSKKKRAKTRYKVKLAADERFRRFWNYAHSQGRSLDRFISEAIEAHSDRLEKNEKQDL
jgi:hypothetical protein